MATAFVPCLATSAGSRALYAEGLLPALYRRAGKAHAPVMESEAPALSCDVTDAERDDVAATLAGDGEAYRRLVERHQNRIAAVMWRFARDRGRLEELVQDVFVEAYAGLRSFDRARPLGPWLRGIAVRVGYRYWKGLARSRREVPIDDVAEPAAASEDCAPERAAEILHGLLARLAPRDRLVLTLLCLEGCSVAEAAQLAGWSKTMVKVQAHRARARLRKLVGAGGGQGETKA